VRLRCIRPEASVKLTKMANGNIDHRGASPCDTVSARRHITPARALTDDLFVRGHALSINVLFERCVSQDTETKSVCLSWENETPLLSSETPQRRVFLQIDEAKVEKKQQRASLVHFLKANPLNRIPTLKEICRTAQFESEQESTWKSGNPPVFFPEESASYAAG